MCDSVRLLYLLTYLRPLAFPRSSPVARQRPPPARRHRGGHSCARWLPGAPCLISATAPGPMSTDAPNPTPAMAGVKRSADHTSNRGTHGRSLRARASSRQPYVDDDPNLVAALNRSERRDKLQLSSKAHEGDLEAATACGMPPYELAPFEHQCSALPVALRQEVRPPSCFAVARPLTWRPAARLQAHPGRCARTPSTRALWTAAT